jgi:hypothetical protein
MLHICGTVHSDPRGPERVKNLLDYYKPDVVTVECSDSEIKKIAELYTILEAFSLDQIWYLITRHINPNQLMTMYPYTIARYFKQLDYETAIPQQLGYLVVGVDVIEGVNPSYHDFLCGCMQLPLEARAVEEFALSPDDYQRFVDEYFYPSADHITEDAEGLENVIERNKFMVSGIEVALSLGSVVHLSGDAHVHGPSPNLVDLLAQYSPTFSKLKDWD